MLPPPDCVSHNLLFIDNLLGLEVHIARLFYACKTDALIIYSIHGNSSNLLCPELFTANTGTHVCNYLETSVFVHTGGWWVGCGVVTAIKALAVFSLSPLVGALWELGSYCLVQNFT